MNARYLLYIFITLSGIVGYYVHLLYYLKSISNPYPLVALFFGSLIFALANEVKSDVNKLTFAGLGATMLYFNIGAELAIYLREIVLNLIQEHVIEATAEVQSQIGTEYIIAAKNKIVSIGACMGVGLIVSRVLFYNLFSKLFFIVLKVPAKKRNTCPRCNK